MGRAPGSSHGNEHHILLGILLDDRMGKCQVARVVVTLLELLFFFFLLIYLSTKIPIS